MTSSTRSQALVTGGTGFIAMYVIKRLLENGHVVHTTVRSLKDKKKSKSLFELQSKYLDHLRVFEADLMKGGSFGQAMKGCDIVYHIASPFLVPAQIKDGLKDCVEPALNGTRNVLISVNETSSVTRVVLTSSSKWCCDHCVPSTDESISRSDLRRQRRDPQDAEQDAF